MKWWRQKQKQIVLRQLNPCPLLVPGHIKYCPEGFQPTHPFNNGYSWGVRRPGVAVKIFQGLPPRVCVHLCVLVGFRGQSPRSYNPPHLGCPGGPNFCQGSPLPPSCWCGLWRCGRKKSRGSPYGLGEGGDVSLSLRRLWLILQHLCPLLDSVDSCQILPTSLPTNAQVGKTKTTTDNTIKLRKGKSCLYRLDKQTKKLITHNTVGCG